MYCGQRRLLYQSCRMIQQRLAVFLGFVAWPSALLSGQVHLHLHRLRVRSDGWLP
jgi:uncharacterized membrane protein